MATINVTTAFDVGQKVWLKSALDSVTAINPVADNKFWIEMTIPYILYKVTQIKVRQNPNASYTKLYAIQLFLPESSSPIATTSGVSIQTSYTDIEESNLYDFDDGKAKIDAKIADFNNYITSLTNL